MIEILNNKINKINKRSDMDCFSKILQKILEKIIFIFFIFIHSVVLAFFKNFYLFLIAFKFLFNQLFFQISFDKGRISPETFGRLINIFRLFYKGICIYFIKNKKQKQTISSYSNAY